MPLYAVVSVADAEAARASVAAAAQPFDVLLAEVRPQDPCQAALLAAHLSPQPAGRGFGASSCVLVGPFACACTPCGGGTAKTVHISFIEFLEGCSPSRGQFAGAKRFSR